MAVIPGRIERGATVRTGVDYARYGQATWKWWCKRHGVHFVLLDRPLGGKPFRGISPTIQRWLAPSLLVEEYGPDTKIAMVDADTMIRWDAPDLFEAAGSGFAAVRTTNARWVSRSIQAYTHFFPGVVLPWWEYFNSGVVVLGAAQLKVIKQFTDFASENWSELLAVQRTGDVGSDQTPLNLMIRREGEPVNFIPSPFNLLDCVPQTLLLWNLEVNPGPEQERLARETLSQPELFDFIHLGYIWHFTNVRVARRMVMKETWRRVCVRYPGAPSL